MQRISELQVNGAKLRINADADRSLLSVLRDDLDLTGSKYGCAKVNAEPVPCSSMDKLHARA